MAKKKEDRFINVKDYALSHGLQDNGNKPASLLKAINAIEQEHGILDIFSLGEVIIAKVGK